MAKAIDLTGQRFGRLVVMERAENYNKKVRWLCKCDCGNERAIYSDSLRHAGVKSCGCLAKEKLIQRNKGYSTHGKTNTRLHRIWRGMKERCFNPNFKKYEAYGGRGITVCQEWENNFISFYNWAMENNYEENLTLDRIDGDKNYCPENCRWSTFTQQNNNRRTTKYITYNQETHSLGDWCRILKKPYRLIYHRLYSGWSIEKAFEK